MGPYPVDGFCSSTSTIFQFHGWYDHGHACEKTIGNSAYGGLMDKLKHRNVQYIQAQKNVNKPDFFNLTLLEDSMYEVEKAKSKIVLDLPIQFGYFI